MNLTTSMNSNLKFKFEREEKRKEKKIQKKKESLPGPRPHLSAHQENPSRAAHSARRHCPVGPPGRPHTRAHVIHSLAHCWVEPTYRWLNPTLVSCSLAGGSRTSAHFRLLRNDERRSRRHSRVVGDLSPLSEPGPREINGRSRDPFFPLLPSPASLIP
jgi:hypothetical protein